MNNDNKELQKAFAILHLRFKDSTREQLLQVILSLGVKVNQLECELKNYKKE